MFKFWIRVKFYGDVLDRYFETYPKMNNFVRKHNIKDKDIIFIRTRKELIKQMK